MAASSCLLTEERFQCSICLDVFTDPVTTPCGHNFCSTCIHKYWDSNNSCQCPFCKEVFSPGTHLKVNTMVSELVSALKTSVQVKATTTEPGLNETTDVLCDICSEKREKAVKSCLMCMASFCEAHLEPHLRVARMKSHTLLNPVKDLDDRMCKEHSKMTELYCRTDKACICALCIKTNHKGHEVVPLEEEYEAVMAKKDVTTAGIEITKQSLLEKIAAIEDSVTECQKEAEKEKEASMQAFDDLICSIQSSRAEILEAIEERCRATKQKAEDFITLLRREVADLDSRSSQLEKLWQSEDHHLLLQSFQTFSSTLNKNWADVNVHSDMSFDAARGSISLLKQRVGDIMENLPEIKMKRMREHAVDLNFDPETAYCSLVISQGGKKVTEGGRRPKLPPHPKRFEMFSEVLAEEGFTTGKFYYEVQIKDKTDWIIGVVKESIDRKTDAPLSEEDGAWTIGLDDGIYQVYNKDGKISVKEKLQKVGVFVDYNKGVVSFYDADSKSHLYSYTGCFFTEKLYPYFNLQGLQNGANTAPIVITPVPKTH
ncbi:E3 ubiquitin-protein ligase TRIM38-like [Cheilinus undulatus]|uniref:E3 ubiquitin-protein ligase TRIM38-like n=1 Tax=Cheilinus undulatus TaxID=241271 RepID=UPI001BD5146F|nr:E3 ubiquitin-protein ligase TRIM38-like [Cheilinus undulatus]